jgi:hypothetical protein
MRSKRDVVGTLRSLVDFLESIKYQGSAIDLLFRAGEVDDMSGADLRGKQLRRAGDDIPRRRHSRPSNTVTSGPRLIELVCLRSRPYGYRLAVLQRLEAWASPSALAG